MAGAHTAPQRWAEAPDGGGRWWFSGATGAREGGGNAANRRQRAEEAWRRAKEDRRRHRVEEDRRRREAEERQWPAPRHREAARGMQPPTTSVGGLQTSGATLVGGFRTTLVGGRVPRVLRALERASLTCCPRRDAPGDPRHDVPAFGGRAGLRLGRRIGRGWARIRISSSGGTRSLPVTCASFPRRAARPAAGAWATLSTFSALRPLSSARLDAVCHGEFRRMRRRASVGSARLEARSLRPPQPRQPWWSKRGTPGGALEPAGAAALLAESTPTARSPTSRSSASSTPPSLWRGRTALPLQRSKPTLQGSWRDPPPRPPP